MKITKEELRLWGIAAKKWAALCGEDEEDYAGMVVRLLAEREEMVKLLHKLSEHTAAKIGHEWAECGCDSCRKAKEFTE